MSVRRWRTLGTALPAWILAGLLAVAVAQDADPARPLFGSDATLELTLEAPWAELVRDRQARQRYPALLSYTDDAGGVHRIEATVEARGLTRLEVCRFPPLRLRFARDATRGSEFAGQRSLKMVTHCLREADQQQYYVQEYLAYRILNLSTTHSFRVRPLAVTYRDRGTGREDGPRFAFLVESLGELGRRTGYRRAPQAEFAPGDFEPVALTRFMLFQYLIGNTDFEVLSGPRDQPCCHNVRVTAPPGGNGLVAVPYDFDSAGMIDASYAAPHPVLPIRSVTQRVYRGFCIHDGALEPMRAEFLARREAVLALVHAEPRLSAARRGRTLRYFNAFFDILGDDKRFDREFRAKCRR